MYLSKIEDKVTELVIRKKKQTKEEVSDRDDLSETGAQRNTELNEKVQSILKNSSMCDVIKNEDVLLLQQETFNKVKSKYFHEDKEHASLNF